MDTTTKAIRLDKYLWACRFYKTRNIAKGMIDGGKVDYNNIRAKSSKIVEIGALITLPFGRDKITIEVKALSDERKSYSIAKELYQETAESIKKRQELQQLNQLAMLQISDTKPSKKQRRDIEKFKQQNYI